MFCQLIAICLALVTSSAQEHFTCLRTNDVNSSSPQLSPDNFLVKSLRDNITRDLQRGYVEVDDGWIAPFNGYQYKRNSNPLPWEESRTVCQNWGGDLIVHGFRDYAVKVTITRALDLNNIWFWIGLTDMANEGNWRWVSGHRARADDVTLWLINRPRGRDNEDCGRVFFSDNSIDGFAVVDGRCDILSYSICEKLI